MANQSLYERIGGEEGLNLLLKHFYADVRQHAVLGPIFNARIHNWPAHLAKIAEFWKRQTGGPSVYAGGFGMAHLPLGIRTEHFTHWLGLWDFNCKRNLAAPEAAEMSERAHHIGRQLERLLEGRAGLFIQGSQGA